MLTDAIGFVQNVQTACFAIIFLLMAAKDRTNRSLRWIACTYLCGLVGGLFTLAGQFHPAWISVAGSNLAAPLAYACLHMGIVEFVRRGRATRWVAVVLTLGSLPFYIAWAMQVVPMAAGMESAPLDRIYTLGDFALAVQTAFSAWLLLSTQDEESAWPRRVMGIFLCCYSAVEFARVAVFLYTGQTPDLIAPWVEDASGVVYVVSCSVLPLAFIWMMNARLHAHMARQMTTDSLTEVLNRRGLQQAGELELARYARGRQDFVLILVDIDHFKKLNDTFGHGAGDAVLREIAQLFRRLLREGDVVGRYGGEEFVLLLPATPSAAAMSLVERLRTSLAAHRFRAGGQLLCVTASFGVTVGASREGLAWDKLINEADTALYAAKRAGRNLSRLYPISVDLSPDEDLPSIEDVSSGYDQTLETA